MAFDPTSIINLIKRRLRPSDMSGPDAHAPHSLPDIQSQSDFAPPTDSVALRPRIVNPQPAPTDAPPLEAPTAMRPRVVKPVSPYEAAVDRGRGLAADPNMGPGGTTLKRPSRLMAGITQALGGAGDAANRALASGNVGWGGVAQALGGAAGGGAVGAADPGILLKARHDKAVADNQSEQDRALEQMKREAEVKDIQSRADNRGSSDEKQTTRIVRDGEYKDVKAGTEIRSRYNAATHQTEDILDRNGNPVVSKLQPVEKDQTIRPGDLVKGPDGNYSLPKGAPPPSDKHIGEKEKVTNTDGSESIVRYEGGGKWNTEFTGQPAPKTADKTEELQANYESENIAAEQLKKTGNELVPVIEGLGKQISSIREQLAKEKPGQVQDDDASKLAGKPVFRSVSVPDIAANAPQRKQLEEQVTKLEAQATEAKKAQKDAFDKMEEHRAIARKYQRSGKSPAAKSTPAPTTHAFSKSAWLQANPGGDVTAKAKAAKAAGYTVVN